MKGTDEKRIRFSPELSDGTKAGGFQIAITDGVAVTFSYCSFHSVDFTLPTTFEDGVSRRARNRV